MTAYLWVTGIATLLNIMFACSRKDAVTAVIGCGMLTWTAYLLHTVQACR